MAISTSIVLDPDADLAAALARRGQDVVLARGDVAKTVRALVRRYDPKDLAAGSALQQGDSQVIIAGDAVTDWPVDGAGIGSSGGDVRIPRLNDKMTIAGTRRNVVAAAPFYHNDELVRVEIQVRG